MKTLTHFFRYGMLLICCLMTALQASANRASLQGDDITRGSLMTRNELGEVQALPLLDTDVNIEITGPIARTVVTQTFKNTGDRWIEALYLFPLPQDAAVDRMRMLVGDRVIEGDIKEREEAKAVYQQAKAEGKRSALVEQDRPNLFSTSVANIPPGGRVSVRIEYQQSLAWRDGEFRIRFPMAITPRYSGALPEPVKVVESASALKGGWSLLPGERPNQILPLEDDKLDRPVTLQATLRAGFALSEVKSHYHRINQTEAEDGAVKIELAAPEQSDRDFVLSWKPVPSQQPDAAFFAETSEKGRFGLLMFTPPEIDGWELPARELIFVVDTSGSMGGRSIQAARAALVSGLAGLKPGDRFNIIEFNSDTSALFTSARPASAANLKLARRFIAGLEADGGTNMLPALDLALQPETDNPRLRQVVFITDGAVSQELALFSHIQRKLGHSRLFTVGIGSAPSSYFMEEAALAGHGFFTYIAQPDEAEMKMSALFDKLSKPVLANIQVMGEGVSGFAPASIPDLYAGEPLVVAMQLAEGINRIKLQGQMGDTLWKQTLEIDSVDVQSGVAIDWARRMIAHWQRAGIRGASSEEIRDRITELALKFHLVSPYTSLVAVDKTPVRPVDEALERKALPGKKPQGLTVKQLLPLAQGATGYAFSLIIGATVLCLGLGLLLWQRRSNHDGQRVAL